MPGVSRRIKLNVSNSETDLRRVVSEVNRLPFAFVGFSAVSSASFAPPSVSTWASVSTFVQGLNFDSILTGNVASAKVPDGADGVFQLSLSASVSAGTGKFRVARSNVALFEVVLGTDVKYAVSPPIELKVGDVLTFEFQSASLSYTLAAGCAVSAYRIGLTP
jgi:hypothetical protein